MKKHNPLISILACDGYKVGHYEQDALGVQKKYFTWTPRSNKYLPQVDKVAVFNIQGMIQKHLVEFFDNYFFYLPKEDVVNEYKRVLSKYLFKKSEDISTGHIEKLHDLGYLPLEIKALEEGTLSNIHVPIFTIENTIDDFYWLAGYTEDILSTSSWQPMTVASIAYQYKKLFKKYAFETVGNAEFCNFQGHDFSYRGLMAGIDAAQESGAAWATSFYGSDSIPAFNYLENYYNADAEKEIIICSVPASEHSVACTYGPEGEDEYLRRLIQDVYPSGIVSIVSDTWDLFDLITNKLSALKDIIMSRDGKVVIRPDSGNPADILCGSWKFDSDWEGPYDVAIKIDKRIQNRTPEEKGVIELLWDIFGGTVNSKGYKELDSHIGTIYGDSITLELAEEICDRLKEKGFASTNWVAGVGSWSLLGQLSRDSLGFALKETSIVKNNQEIAVFKDPKTDDGTKKSQRGRVVVLENENGTYFIDGLNSEQEAAYTDNLLKQVFYNGKLTRETSLNQIREKINNQ